MTSFLRALPQTVNTIRIPILIFMGGCQNYGPFLGILNIRGRIIIGTPKRDHNFDNHPYKGRDNINAWRLPVQPTTCSALTLP